MVSFLQRDQSFLEHGMVVLEDIPCCFLCVYGGEFYVFSENSPAGRGIPLNVISGSLAKSELHDCSI